MINNSFFTFFRSSMSAAQKASWLAAPILLSLTAQSLPGTLSTAPLSAEVTKDAYRAR